MIMVIRMLRYSWTKVAPIPRYFFMNFSIDNDQKILSISHTEAFWYHSKNAFVKWCWNVFTNNFCKGILHYNYIYWIIRTPVNANTLMFLGVRINGLHCNGNLRHGRQYQFCLVQLTASLILAPVISCVYAGQTTIIRFYPSLEVYNQLKMSWKISFQNQKRHEKAWHFLLPMCTSPEQHFIWLLCCWKQFTTCWCGKINICNLTFASWFLT